VQPPSTPEHMSYVRPRTPLFRGGGGRGRGPCSPLPPPPLNT